MAQATTKHTLNGKAIKPEILFSQMDQEFTKAKEDTPSSLFKSSIVDPNKEIEKPPIIFSINDVPFGTLGNISLITGNPKSMKSMLLALLAGGAAVGIPDFIHSQVTDKSIIYFDTEQSPYHASLQAKRIQKIAQGNGSRITYIALRKYPPKKRMDIIKYGIENTSNLGFVIIDGVTDLVYKGVNDEVEATEICNILMAWSEIHNIHITTILHSTKGNDSKQAKGHLGSYLQQKCETVLMTTKDKDSNTSKVEPHYSRGMDLKPFQIGVDEFGIPFISDSIEDVNHSDKPKKSPFDFELSLHKVLVSKVFQKGSELLYKDFIGELKYHQEAASIVVGEKKLREWVTYYINQKLIFQEGKRKPYTQKQKATDGALPPIT